MHPVDYVFQAICEGFVEKPRQCFSENNVSQSTSTSHTVVTIIVIIIAVVFVMFIGFFFYRRIVRREFHKEMTLQIDTMVSQYFAIGDTKAQQEKDKLFVNFFSD